MAEWPPSPGCSPLAGYSASAEYPPLAEHSPLPGSSALAGTAGPAAPLRWSPGALPAVAPPLHKTRQETSRHEDKTKSSGVPRQEKRVNPRLTLGAALRAALGAAHRSSARVRQDRLRHTPCCRSCRVFRDLDLGRLGLLRGAIGQGPETRTEDRVSISRSSRQKLRRWRISDPYSWSSSSSSLRAEKSYSTVGASTRGAGGEESLARLVLAGAGGCEDPAPVVAGARGAGGAVAPLCEDSCLLGAGLRGASAVACVRAASAVAGAPVAPGAAWLPRGARAARRAGCCRGACALVPVAVLRRRFNGERLGLARGGEVSDDEERSSA